MFGIRKGGSGKIFAVADIGSGSAGVAIIAEGETPQLFALARETLPLDQRSEAAPALPGQRHRRRDNSR